MKHQKIYVNGMTCINCQNRIASTLQQTSGITETSVSYETGVAEITYDPKKISMEQIIARINSLGYSASTQNTSKKENIIRAVREIAIIAVIFFLLQRLEILNRLAPGKLADSEMGYGALFVIGLITSVHCIAMCGGINLSQTLSSEKNGPMFRNSLQYNIGRVISYTVIGGILGAIGALAGIGDSLQTSTFFQGMLKLFAGIIMVVMGINMLGIFPGLRKLKLRIPNFGRNIITRPAGKTRTPFIIGLCNGFMPCGPLQSMQIVALASGSYLTGAVSMFCFSLGTVPLMLGFGSAVSMLGKKFTRQVLKAGSILVVVMGLSMMVQGGTLSGISSKTTETLMTENINASTENINPPKTNSESALADSSAGDEDQSTESDTNSTTDTNGIQYVTSTLQAGSYPDITVKAGEPVEWTIDAPDGSINGCNYSIIQQDLGIQYSFNPGENVIEFTPTEAGTYTYTCWMGMITGKIYVES